MDYKITDAQNNNLSAYISAKKDESSMQNNGFIRNTEKKPTLETASYVLLCIYGVVFIIFCIILIISNKMKWYMKLIWIFIFALYPFLIYAIENQFYQVIYYIYSVLYGESYARIHMRN